MLAMMDSNENENYCYQHHQQHEQQQQQQPSPIIAKTGNVSKGAIPKDRSTGLKYQNQYNNNNNIAEQENLMPHQQVEGETEKPGEEPTCTSNGTGMEVDVVGVVG